VTSAAPFRPAGRETISCIVVTHNAVAYIREALDSVLGQTHSPSEVIVIDSGSSDGTPDVAAAYGSAVRVVRIPDVAPPSARNRGIDEAGGDLIAFLDGDDVWHREKLQRQVGRFRERPELQCSLTYAQNFWASELAEEGERYREQPRARPIPGYATTSLLARREVFDVVGRLNADLWYADSTDWFLRARERGIEMELLPEVLLYRRVRPGSLTRRGAAQGRQEYLALLRESIARRRERARE
jgi:glycosyltransferase involved in cell wall biosynthesis